MYSREELKTLRIEFWELFARHCENVPELASRKKTWVLHRTKISNVALKFEPGRETAQVMVEISHKNEDKRLEAFMAIEKYKTLLEEGFENGLVWDYAYTRFDSGQEVCRIFTTLEGVDFHRKNHWPAIFDFFVKNMLLLETNFMEISDLVKNEIEGKN